MVVCLGGLSLAGGCSIHSTGLGGRDGGGRGLDAGAAWDARIDAPVPGVDAGVVPPEDAGSGDGDSGTVVPTPDSGSSPTPDAGPPPGGVGAGCGSSLDCEPGLFCMTHASIPGGYCTRGCGSSAPCPPGSQCVDLDGTLLCARTCSGPTDCRAGYSCAAFDSIGWLCVPTSWL